MVLTVPQVRLSEMPRFDHEHRKPVLSRHTRSRVGDPGSRRSASLGRMTAMAVIGITGSTDGIGRATARVLLADGHRVLVHARSRGRGEPVAKALGGDVALVVGDLARIDDVGRLAEQAREHGPIDRWVHNAGVWVRGSMPRTSADGHETTFAVNVLAPHLLTHLMSAELQGRLLWLGSGLAGSARPQPAAIGRETDPRRAYAESKACDVALALAWNRRLPDVISVAVDPGWVKAKLASPRRPRRRQLVRGHHRLLLHGTRPGLGALLEERAPTVKTNDEANRQISHRRQTPQLDVDTPPAHRQLGASAVGSLHRTASLRIPVRDTVFRFYNSSTCR
jgi:NAD(P)-dependent dehydrogenase (short-subunit alcohol dehydrogenase family)